DGSAGLHHRQRDFTPTYLTTAARPADHRGLTPPRAAQSATAPCPSSAGPTVALVPCAAGRESSATTRAVPPTTGSSAPKGTAASTQRSAGRSGWHGSGGWAARSTRSTTACIVYRSSAA